MSEAWSYQLSVKIEGQHLLNLRADDGVGFSDMLKYATENREAILTACAALGATEKPRAAAPAATQGPRPVAPLGAASREIGPIVLEGVEIKKAGRDGVAFKSPLFIVKWDGASATTFDALVGKAAMGFWSQGHSCYVTIEPSQKNPKYTNLVSIRMAA